MKAGKGDQLKIRMRIKGISGVNMARIFTFLKVVPLLIIPIVGLWIFGTQNFPEATALPLSSNATLSGAALLTLWCFVGLESALRAWPLLLAAFLVMFPTYVLVTIRFHFVLELFRLKVPFRKAVDWTMIGSFSDVFMPGSSGGDLIKIGYVVSYFGKGNRSRGTLSVLYDRLAGLVGLFFVSLIAFFVGYSTLSVLPNSVWLGLSIVCLCALSIAFFFLMTSQTLSQHSGFQRLLLRFPWGTQVSRALEILVSTRQNRAKTLGVMGLSLVNHLFWSLSIFLITLAFGHTLNPAAVFTVVPLVLFLNVFGFAGGFGVGTVAFDVLFSLLLGIQDGASIAIVYQLLSLLSRLSGLPFFILEKKA